MVDKTQPKLGSKFSACRLFDFEMEMGVFVGGKANNMGDPIRMEKADDRVFGFVLLNDWSARDIQKWEYVPLGPFNGKNFASTISPWIVTLDALLPFWGTTSAGKQDNPVPLPYLRDPNYGEFDVKLEVLIQAPNMSKPHKICDTNFLNMYWNHRQQLVHHSITGCNMQPGDMFGSGTISGAEKGHYGSMLENCWAGKYECALGDSGEVRKFLKDGDNVIMRGHCEGDGYRVGFGDCAGEVLPAHTYQYE